MTLLRPTSFVRRSKGVLFTRMDDDLLALDEKAGFVYALNATSARIWELIEQPTSIEAICRDLRQEFGVAEETCLRNVVEVLEHLKEAGIVEQMSEAR